MERRKRRTLKKIKDSELKIRILSDKKERIKKYCEENNITMTKFLNLAIDSFLED